MEASSSRKVRTFDGPSARRTQRAPKSCTACVSRKSKCSKEVPCTQCIARGIGDLCTRERVLVKGLHITGGSADCASSVASVDDLIAQNRTLKEQLAQMQEQLGGPIPHQWKSNEDNPVLERNDLEKMATALNLIEMSRDSDGHVMEEAGDPSPDNITVPWNLRGATYLDTPSQDYLGRLPDVQQSTRLVAYAVYQLGWLYSVSHGPTFLREHQLLLSRIQEGHSPEAVHGPMWLSYYFAQLALASHHMPQAGLTEEQLVQRSSQTSTWFGTSLDLLMTRTHFMVKPEIGMARTVCTLTPLFHIYGPPMLRNTLLAVAIRVAQSLGCHLLGPDQNCEPLRDHLSPCEVHGILEEHIVSSPTLQEREYKRRLWWNLLYRDWIAVPAGLPYAVALEHLQVGLPANLSDLSLSAEHPVAIPSPSVITTASFQIGRARLARLTHAFFSQYRGLKRSDPERQLLVAKTDLAYQSLFDDMPFFKDTTTPFVTSPDVTQWLPNARYLMVSLVAHKRLLLHRDGFALAFRNDSQRPSRDACVCRAMDILEAHRNYGQSSAAISETASHLLASAVVLVLDFCFPPVSFTSTEAEHRQRRNDIEDLINLLKTRETFESHSDRIALQLETLIDTASPATRPSLQPTSSHPSTTAMPQATHSTPPHFFGDSQELIQNLSTWDSNWLLGSDINQSPDATSWPSGTFEDFLMQGSELF